MAEEFIDAHTVFDFLRPLKLGFSGMYGLEFPSVSLYNLPLVSAYPVRIDGLSRKNVAGFPDFPGAFTTLTMAPKPVKMTCFNVKGASFLRIPNAF